MPSPERKPHFFSKAVLAGHAAVRARKAHAIGIKLANFAKEVEQNTLGQMPWERLPGEPELQFDRFRAYLTFPKPRHMTKFAPTVGVAAATLNTVAEKYHWKLRADCWARELDRQEDEAFAEEKRSAARRQARLGASLQTLAEKGIACHLTMPGEMSVSDIARIADVGVKIERLAHDKSTVNESTVTRFIYEGNRPAWMGAGEEVEANQQVTAGPLTQRLHDHTRQGQGAEVEPAERTVIDAELEVPRGRD